MGEVTKDNALWEVRMGDDVLYTNSDSFKSFLANKLIAMSDKLFAPDLDVMQRLIISVRPNLHNLEVAERLRLLRELRSRHLEEIAELKKGLGIL